MVVVPPVLPVTTPFELTDATAGALDAQGAEVDGLPEPVRVIVASTHTVEFPVIVGNGKTVT